MSYKATCRQHFPSIAPYVLGLRSFMSVLMNVNHFQLRFLGSLHPFLATGQVNDTPSPRPYLFPVSLFHHLPARPAPPRRSHTARRKYRIGRDGIIAMAAAKSAAMIIGENKKWDNSASRKLAPSRGKMQAGGRKQCISARP